MIDRFGGQMFEDIKDKKVLVTGASSGIGACIAELFSSYGAVVGIHYNNNEEGARRKFNSIKSWNKKAGLFKADLLNFKEVETLFNSFIERFGRIDVLINNAGAVIGDKDFLEIDEEFWDKTFFLNLKAPFFLATKAFSFMKGRGGGRVINISSVAAKYGGSERSLHYGAAKAALENVTVALARLGAPYDILVNCIRASVIDTPFHQKFEKRNLEKRIKLIPLKRMGKPIDIARMALFLASNGGNFITGQIFSVTGGE